MDSVPSAETDGGVQTCSVCGSGETGYFCRQCGALLRGGDRVLCPRCHQIVPDGEYCNQCGQGLGSSVLHLEQLAIAGDVFWVTDEGTATLPPPEVTVLEPDESVDLADPELPAWLRDLSAVSVPDDVASRVYPALEPIEEERGRAGRGTFVTVIVLVMFAVMLAIVVLSFLAFFRG